jgi:1-acyl-sn-glycerol-3-phosphate acyltransferase
MHRALEVLRAGEPLVIFPEGTRKVGPAVEDILEGAAYLALRARVPIVPLGISGAEDAMPRGAYFPRPARVAIVVGTPLGGTDLAPAQGEAEHRMTRSQTKVLANELRETMQEVFSTAQATKLSSRLGSRGAAKRRGRKADVSISD